MQQMLNIAAILDSAGIAHLPSEHGRGNKTDAHIIPLFTWKGQHAGIVIDCDPGDMKDICITGHLPATMTDDIEEPALLQAINKDNADTVGVQIFARDGSVYVRKTVDTTYGIYADIIINAIYDIRDVMNKYKRDARKRGNFPVSESSYKEANLPT